MKFSVVLYMNRYNETLEAVNSIKSNKCFKDIQLLVIDPFCDEESESITKSFECNNIQVIKKEECSEAEAYKIGLEKAEGDFINFTLASSVLSEKGIDKVSKYLSQKKTNGENVRLFTVDVKGISNINDVIKDVKYHMQSYSEGLFDIAIDTGKINLVLQSYFIDKALAKSVQFNPELNVSASHDYLLSLIESETEIYNIKSCVYTYYEPLEQSAATCETAKIKEWYTFSMKNCFTPKAKALKEKYKKIPLHLQIAMYYLTWEKWNNNFAERDKEALSREEAFEFYDSFCEFLSYIDDNVIFQDFSCKYTVARSLKIHFYMGKCKFLGVKPCDVKVIDKGYYEGQLVLNDDAFKSSDDELWEKAETREEIADCCTLGLAKNQQFTVRVIDFINGNVEIDLDFPSYLLDTTDYEVFAKIGDNKYVDMKETELYSLNKFFGITINRQKTYHLSVPAKDFLNKRLAFGFKIDGKEYFSEIRFIKIYSRLTNSNASYYKLNNDLILCYKNDALTVETVSHAKRFMLELKFFAYRLLRTPVSFKMKRQYLMLRLIYWIVYPFMSKKRVWITFDKLYKAGDDGEYMFQYCRKNAKDDVDIYYIIDKEAPDYERLKKQHGKYVLRSGSFKLKLLALYCEVVLATHATVYRYLGYNNKTMVFIKDLFKGVIVCIQHGLTIQKIAQYQNRVYDDTRLYTLASKYEKENVEKPIYDFFGKELKLTGLARYDGLKNNDQKQILITPTWRRNVVNLSIAFVKKTHNESFKNSEYFRIYNSLVNDEKLIECAKKTGYKLIYLLHPAMSSQAEDFDRNDYVEIVQATGDMSYEKILTESSLMVTDYSGVQFDFAYQRKPIVYYHPETLPPHYGEGGLIYETMGFGPICKNHNEIISTLCSYMENQCKTEPEYIHRADDFFCYDDFNSCERIYKEVTDFLNNSENF